MTSKVMGDGVKFSNLSSPPSNPESGQVYFDTNTDQLKVWDGAEWANVADASGQFLTRQIITHGFVAGGYQSSSPWRNVNTMVHATDVMTNNGDVLPSAATYTSGACSLSNAFLWSADNTFPGSAAGPTAAFNMFTMTGFTGPSMTVARNDMATLHKEHEKAWIVQGGSTAIDVFNLTTETMYTSQGQTSPDAGDSAQSGGAAHSSETSGIFWSQNGDWKMSFGTGTTVTITTATDAGAHSQQKGVSSKVGKGYAGNEGGYNGGYNLRIYNYATDSMAGTCTKPVGNCGEENFDMGQAWQYMMGCYDGVQNNRGWKFTYATNSGYELGAGSVRTGVPGGSSGHCFWRG